VIDQFRKLLRIQDPAELTADDRLELINLLGRAIVAIRSDPIRSDPIRSDPIRSDPIRSDPIRSDPIRSDPIRSDPIIPRHSA
jgi:hypothetical protein